MPSRKPSNRGPSAAEENRSALLDAARRVLDESGSLAPFNAIAKEAGVGQGSLYRHFPNRAVLTLAVFAENVAKLEILAADETTRLADFLDEIFVQAVGSLGFGELAGGLIDAPEFRAFESRLRTMIEQLLGREPATELNTDDVLLGVRIFASVLMTTPDDQKIEIGNAVLRVLEPTLGSLHRL